MVDEACDLAEYEAAPVLPGLIDTHLHLVADSEIGALDRVPALSDQETPRRHDRRKMPGDKLEQVLNDHAA
jgi:cytosine/adenosine deaminase-related metal-dependent hydrolase